MSPDILRQILAGRASNVKMKPAAPEDVAHLLVRQRPEAGDIVKLRAHVKADKFTDIRPGETAVVTQSFAAKRDLTKKDIAAGAEIVDIAIAIMSEGCACGEPDCKNAEPEVIEFLHDSRDFEIVGNVHAPSTQ